MIRKFTKAVAALIMLASVVSLAPASADAPVVREKFAETFDFFNEDYSAGCGVEVLSSGTVRGQFNMFADGTLRVHENGTIIHTNSETGDRVYETWAATFWVDASESVGEDGLLTIHETVRANGVPIKFSAKGVGTIVRDAGTITFENTIVLDFSLLPGDPLVSFDQEILREGGPHPLFDGINPEEGAALCSAIGAPVG